MQLSTDDTEALRKLLEDRRKAVAPESLGYGGRSGVGRPVEGLSQEQIDELTGRARGTYSRLVNGRLERPKPQYLQDIARLLRMTEQEWTHLYWLTRREYPAPLHEDAGMVIPGVWSNIHRIEGVIAYVADAAWNLITCNREFEELFPGNRPPSNVLLYMATDPTRHTLLLDWEQSWAPWIFPQLRRAISERPEDEELKRLEQLVLSDREAGPIYTGTGLVTVPFPDGAQRPFRHPRHGDGVVDILAADPRNSRGAGFVMLAWHSGDGSAARQEDLRAPVTLASRSLMT
ncbi:helix-turn-helix domain-containing protein [Streptomyces sp. NPDC058001]|uniref:MmyB family transcriptional regulator n=1 Tax=Streptomyces sp. NPDC058001 TaxID=3346300 RepID=UPI0036E573D6